MSQQTFLMLKPDAFDHHHEHDILRELTGHGLTIEHKAMLTVDMEIMKTLLEHYQAVIDHMDKAFDFPGKLFNSFYYDGPHTIMVMIVSYQGDEDIITYTRNIVGKTNPREAAAGTIRAEYSDDDYVQATKEWRLVNNVIHASDSHENAMREAAIWNAYFL